MSPDGPEASFQKADAKVGVLFETAKSFKVFLLSPSRAASLCEREEKERRKKPGAAHCKDVKKRTLYLSKAGAKIGKGKTTPKHKGNFFTQNAKLFRKRLGNRGMKGRAKKGKGKGDTLLYYKGGVYYKGGTRGRAGKATEEDREKKEGKGKKEGGKARQHKKKQGKDKRTRPIKKGRRTPGHGSFRPREREGKEAEATGTAGRREGRNGNATTREQGKTTRTVQRKKNKKGRIKNGD